MSLLSICTAAANNAGVAAPISIIGNSDPGAARLLQMASRTGKSIARKANWASLVTEHTWNAGGATDFTLPADYRSMVDDTMWDRSRFWQMRGAMSPQQWQFYKSSTIGNAAYQQRWRIHLAQGAVAGAPVVFSVDPPITEGDNSEFVFEYVSNNWCRSVTKFELAEAIPNVPGTDYAEGDTITLTQATITVVSPVIAVVSVDGGAVVTAEVITPGSFSAAPTALTQASTSGAGAGFTASVTSNTVPGLASSDWTADTDIAVIDENLIELGVIWRLLSRLGMAYLEEKDEFERELDKAIARDGGGATLNLTPRPFYPLVGLQNAPDGNWPGPR